MALKTSVDNKEKLGPVTVTQTSLVADTADNDVTTISTSLAGKMLSLQVVNGSTSDIYFKVYDSLSPSLATAVPSFKIKVASLTTEFFGVSLGIPFSTALSVAASTSSGATASPTAYSGTVSYTLIAGT